MQKITPFLWFDDEAEQAARFYTPILRNSTIGEVRYYGDAGPRPKGSVMTVSFNLDGQEFIALNGGPHFTLTPAFLMFVNCETQDEVDELWEKLCEGGEPVRCGCLNDRYGLSWQIFLRPSAECCRTKTPRVTPGDGSDDEDDQARRQCVAARLRAGMTGEVR